MSSLFTNADITKLHSHQYINSLNAFLHDSYCKVSTNGEIKKASLLDIFCEQLKGMIGRYNATHSEVVEYQLIKIIETGVNNGHIHPQDKQIKEIAKKITGKELKDKSKFKTLKDVIRKIQDQKQTLDLPQEESSIAETYKKSHPSLNRKILSLYPEQLSSIASNKQNNSQEVLYQTQENKSETEKLLSSENLLEEKGQDLEEKGQDRHTEKDQEQKNDHLPVLLENLLKENESPVIFQSPDPENLELLELPKSTETTSKEIFKEVNNLAAKKFNQDNVDVFSLDQESSQKRTLLEKNVKNASSFQNNDDLSSKHNKTEIPQSTNDSLNRSLKNRIKDKPGLWTGLALLIGALAISRYYSFPLVPSVIDSPGKKLDVGKTYSSNDTFFPLNDPLIPSRNFIPPILSPFNHTDQTVCFFEDENICLPNVDFPTTHQFVHLKQPLQDVTAIELDKFKPTETDKPIIKEVKPTTDDDKPTEDDNKFTNDTPIKIVSTPAEEKSDHGFMQNLAYLATACLIVKLIYNCFQCISQEMTSLRRLGHPEILNRPPDEDATPNRITEVLPPPKDVPDLNNKDEKFSLLISKIKKIQSEKRLEGLVNLLIELKGYTTEKNQQTLDLYKEMIVSDLQTFFEDNLFDVSLKDCKGFFTGFFAKEKNPLDLSYFHPAINVEKALQGPNNILIEQKRLLEKGYITDETLTLNLSKYITKFNLILSFFEDMSLPLFKSKIESFKSILEKSDVKEKIGLKMDLYNLKTIFNFEYKFIQSRLDSYVKKSSEGKNAFTQKVYTEFVADRLSRYQTLSSQFKTFNDQIVEIEKKIETCSIEAFQIYSENNKNILDKIKTYIKKNYKDILRANQTSVLVLDYWVNNKEIPNEIPEKILNSLHEKLKDNVKIKIENKIPDLFDFALRSKDEKLVKLLVEAKLASFLIENKLGDPLIPFIVDSLEDYEISKMMIINDFPDLRLISPIVKNIYVGEKGACLKLIENSKQKANILNVYYFSLLANQIITLDDLKEKLDETNLKTINEWFHNFQIEINKKIAQTDAENKRLELKRKEPEDHMLFKWK